MEAILLSGIAICSKVILRKLHMSPNISALLGGFCEGAVIHLSLERGSQSEELILFSFIIRICLDFFLGDKALRQTFISLIGCGIYMYFIIRPPQSAISRSRVDIIPSAPLRVRSPPSRQSRLRPREERPPHRASIGRLSSVFMRTSSPPGRSLSEPIWERPRHPTPEPGAIILEPPTPTITSVGPDSQPRESPVFMTPRVGSPADAIPNRGSSLNPRGRSPSPAVTINPRELLGDLSSPEDIIVRSRLATATPTDSCRRPSSQASKLEEMSTPRVPKSSIRLGLYSPSELSILDGEFTEGFRGNNGSSAPGSVDEEITLQQMMKSPAAISDLIITTEYVTPASLEAEGESLSPPRGEGSITPRAATRTLPTEDNSTERGLIQASPSLTGRPSLTFYTPSYNVHGSAWGTARTHPTTRAPESSSAATTSVAPSQMFTALEGSTSLSSRVKGAHTRPSGLGLTQFAMDPLYSEKLITTSTPKLTRADVTDPSPGDPGTPPAPDTETGHISTGTTNDATSKMVTAAEYLSAEAGRTVTSPMVTALEYLGTSTSVSERRNRDQSALSVGSGSGSGLTITQVHKSPQLLQQADAYRKEAKEAYHQCTSLKNIRAQALLDGDRVRALEVYFEIQQLEKKYKKLDRKAKQYYFQAHNPGNKIGEIDVHGLRVEEAIHETEKAVQLVHLSGARKLRVITGWGKHSHPKGVSALRSRILERLSIEHQLDATIQQGNPGALIISW